jgi:branched-chain amino acid transport system substrate-binding protein
MVSGMKFPEVQASGMKCRIVALALTLLVASCGPTSQDRNQSASQSRVPGVSDDEITFGNQTDLSGAMAVQGADSINGARMRFDEVNDAGGIHGRRIRLIVEDTRAKVPDAVAAVGKLINEEHVFAMFLSLGADTDTAVLPEELKKGVPNMFPLSGARSMVQPVNDLEFTERPTYYRRWASP